MSLAHLTGRKQEPSRGEQPIRIQRQQEAEPFFRVRAGKSCGGEGKAVVPRGSHMAAVRPGRAGGTAGPGSLRPGVPRHLPGGEGWAVGCVPATGNPWVIL